MKKRGKFLFTGKKADVTHELYFIIAQVSIALFILWVLLAYVDSIKEDTLFEKIYLSKDLALITNTIYAAPGNVFYEYSNEKANLSKYSFNFESQKVSVQEIKKGEVLSIEHPYSQDLNYNTKNLKLSSEQKFVISKSGEGFGIEKS